jgi:DMSO/TMAO reductase YedYZ molybdopterin-dependent catalytic subunit
MIGADLTAKYVWFQCAEGYSNTIDMPTALHPQTQLTLKFDNKTLPTRLRLSRSRSAFPPSSAFKNPKYVTAMYVQNNDVQNNDAGGYWEP